MNEAEVTVNGQRLSPTQSMTLRVALTGFHSQMTEPNALGDDLHGIGLASSYRQQSSEILSLISGD